MSEDFDDLTEEGSANSEIKQKALESNFGSLDIHDFKVFNQGDDEADVGGKEYTFKVQQRDLKEAVSITRLTVSSTNARLGAVKIKIFERFLILATFSQSSFSEIEIPLTEGCSALTGGKNVSFVFDHSILSDIVDEFKEPIIYFIYKAREEDSERGVLRIDSDETSESTFYTAYPLADFTNYHAKLRPTGEGGVQIDPDVLRRGLNYANLFIQKNDTYTALSLVEVRDGAIHSGFEGAIGVLNNPAFNFDLKVKYETKDTVEGILGKFKKDEDKYLFVTDNYYLIRDVHLIFGFEKSSYTFPSVEKIFNTKCETYTRVPRTQLSTNLGQLSTVSRNENLLVEINITGSGSDSRVTLSTRDDSGMVSSRQLRDVVRAPIEEGVSLPQYPDWTMHVNIHAFRDVVNHFKSEHVDLEQRLAGQAILVHDDLTKISGDDVRTLISSLKPPKTVEKGNAE
jgi:hypothetical protein